MQTDEGIIAGLIGRQIGVHRIDALLAQGGMGLIFKAVPVDSTSARTCVLKLLHHEYQNDPVLRSRFLREGRILAPLNHPNIVNMTTCQEDPEIGPYMLMETLQGQTLKELTRARQQPFPPEKIIDWTQQICQALHYCHRQHVIHRDIKPTNIFINSPESQIEQVKLLDFGIAAAPQEPDAPGERVGTPRYMAPEQILCEPITGQADLYALGVVLFELLTRRPLFQELESDALRKAHLEKQPQRLHDARPDLIFPEALEALVQQLLSKTPEGRPKSAAALYQELTTVFAEGTIQKKEGPLGIVVRSANAPQEAFHADAPTPPSSVALPAVQPGHGGPAAQAPSFAPAPPEPSPSWAELFDADGGAAPQGPLASPSGNYAAPSGSFAAPLSGIPQAPLADAPTSGMFDLPRDTAQATSGAYQQVPAANVPQHASPGHPSQAPQHGVYTPTSQQLSAMPAAMSADPLADSLDANVGYPHDEAGRSSGGALTLALYGLIVVALVVVFYFVALR